MPSSPSYFIWGKFMLKSLSRIVFKGKGSHKPCSLMKLCIMEESSLSYLIAQVLLWGVYWAVKEYKDYISTITMLSLSPLQ